MWRPGLLKWASTGLSRLTWPLTRGGRGQTGVPSLRAATPSAAMFGTRGRRSRAADKGGGDGDGDDWRRPTDWSDAESFLKIAGRISGIIHDPQTVDSLLPSVAVEKQSDLPSRTPRESHAKAVLPLASDELLRRQCTNVFGSVRVGRLLEGMDAFAGYVAYRYCLNPARIQPSPFLLVTALVDEIVLRLGDGVEDYPEAEPPRISPLDNIYFSGFVSWVGKSSMEIWVNVWQQDHKIIESAFVFVARDSVTFSATPVNPLKCETAEDEAYFKRGAENQKLRKAREATSLFKTSPDAKESNLLHQYFLQAVEDELYRGIAAEIAALSDGSIYMETTKYSNVTICHPESRNLHHKIFGGTLMRLAHELAWATTVMHCKARPRLMCIDDINFRLPVDIGSLLQFDALICFTKNCHIVVRVDARVLDPMSGTKELTNTFFMMFRTFDKEPVVQVKPRTYFDCILYLEGRRHYEKMKTTVELPKHACNSETTSTYH